MSRYAQINRDFIRKWERIYERDEGDDEDYSDLVGKVESEVKRTESISKETFKEIYSWKAARAKGNVDWGRFRKYERAISYVATLVSKDPENNLEEAIATLDDLLGIGIPVASTILHFIAPMTIPIVDIRTVQLLKHKHCLDRSKSDYNYRNTIPGYRIFRSKVLEIAKKHVKGDIRRLDRALFAYHKKILGPRIKKRLRKARKCT
ncbi:MAG: hypothetical protein KAW09_10890 [Thermoplasmata archaeon]|nr:hypothetical protein [Thermoplasmata archaeon]